MYLGYKVILTLRNKLKDDKSRRRCLRAEKRKTFLVRPQTLEKKSGVIFFHHISGIKVKIISLLQTHPCSDLSITFCILTHNLKGQ